MRPRAVDAPTRASESVAIADFAAAAPERFARVRRQTALEVECATKRSSRYLLDYRQGRLCLVDTVAAHRPFYVDLDRNRRNPARNDPLRRAMGRGVRHVIDATAGFGADAVHLARAGLAITAVERCAVIAALLEDGLERCVDPVVHGVMRVVHDDALQVLAANVPADVVYLDPMYDAPGRIKSLPRRAMTLARTLAGDDHDADAVLALARAGYRRVVVKRPDKSPPLADGVHHSHHGKTVRYDVYLAASTLSP